MENNRKEYFITPTHEDEAYHTLLSAIKDNDKFVIDHNDTIIINVSPDYSSIVSQRLSHALSTDGEIIDVTTIEVPYPDETELKSYTDDIKKLVNELRIEYMYTKFIFVEAGIIRGTNYELIKSLFLNNFNPEQLLFTALFENTASIFKSDCIGEYYNNNKQDLTFYWETFNKHWS